MTSSNVNFSNGMMAAQAIAAHLRNAGNLTVKQRSTGSQRTSSMTLEVTQDSLDAYFRMNSRNMGRNERAAVKQAFKTLAYRSSRGSTGQRLTATNTRALASKLVKMMETHNKDADPRSLSSTEQRQMGKTAKAILHASAALRTRDFSQMASPQDYDRRVDKVLEELLVKANAFHRSTTGGWLTRTEMQAYISDGQAKGTLSPEMATAMDKVFKYISRYLSRGRTNSSTICIDQRAKAHRGLSRLARTGSSSTFKSINNIALS